jgi:alpha-galactosidase
MIALSEIWPKLLCSRLINVFIVDTREKQEQDLTSISMTTRGSGLELTARWGEGAPVTMRLRLPRQPTTQPSSQPLVEALTTGHGRDWAGRRYVTTAIGRRLRYRGHRIERGGAWQTLSLVQVDEVTGLEFTSVLSVHDEHRAVRAVTRVRNPGAEPVTLLAVTSLVFADFTMNDGGRGVEAMTLLRGRRRGCPI